MLGRRVRVVRNALVAIQLRNDLILERRRRIVLHGQGDPLDLRVRSLVVHPILDVVQSMCMLVHIVPTVHEVNVCDEAGAIARKRDRAIQFELKVRRALAPVQSKATVDVQLANGIRFHFLSGDIFSWRLLADDEQFHVVHVFLDDLNLMFLRGEGFVTEATRGQADPFLFASIDAATFGANHSDKPTGGCDQ